MPFKFGIARDAAMKFLADDADPVKGHAAGTIHVEPEGRVLLLKRAGEEGKDNFVGHWALPGGGVDSGESPVEAAHREAKEEMGYDGNGPMKLFDQVNTPNNMAFHTFVRPARRFIPKLNNEHSDHAWVMLDDLPEPLHPAVAKTLAKIPSGKELYNWASEDEHVAQDSLHSACGGRGCAGCGGSGVSPITYAPMKPSLANDEALAALCVAIDAALAAERGLAFDRAPDGLDIARPGLVVTLAFDKSSESVRRTDNFARLHVKSSPITKAAVNPYYGREIPNYEQLGLDGARIYKLLRHPDEIKKAAQTFNSLPLLSKHVPHTADDHDGDITVGTTGTEAIYQHPYLYNSLAVWSRPGIDHVETGDQKELSSAYSYDADMTPGMYEGEPYDGIMRNMVGNHVALVKKGRAGSDVVVGDEALKQSNQESKMSKKIASLKAGVAYGAIRAHLSGLKLAQDGALPDVSPLFRAVKPGKFNKSAVKLIGEGIGKLLKGKLAQDGDLAGVVEGVQKLMAAVEGDKTVEDEVDPDMDPADEQDPSTGDDVGEDSGLDAICAYLKEKGVPDDVIAAMPGMADTVDGAEDSDNGPTEVQKRRVVEGAKEPKDRDPKGPDGDDSKKLKMGMDAVIAKAKSETIVAMRETQSAIDHVTPVVGKISLAMDSAEQVYQQAFKMLGNTEAAKVKGAGTLKVMFDLAIQGRKSLAMDEENVPATGKTDFASRFPNASRVKRL